MYNLPYYKEQDEDGRVIASEMEKELKNYFLITNSN